jgi:hypothetical protein
MGDSEHRQLARDSLFVMAELRVDGAAEPQRVKVRNLSSGGMMAEGASAVARGQLLKIDIRNIGWVEGSIAWVQGTRCGIAFRDEIDPKIARMPNSGETDQPALVRRPTSALDTAEQFGLLRKV